ncbi:MAG: FkbM family methyltransferase [Magnetococcales bacterium]|nr:FkbM family methyltransferase [Magnetococcales bacterium]NGZ05873.1 FkbM family methyltransferase [Magnetococcales bacterium]
MTEETEALQVVTALFHHARAGTLSDELFFLARNQLQESNPGLAAALAKEWQTTRMRPEASLDDLVHFVNKTKKQKIFFLQIGAMDGVSFDGMYAYIRRFGWDGILVEPLPDMIRRAQEHYQGHTGQLFFENVAITEQEEQRPIYRIPAEVARQAGLPDWTLGISSLRRDHFPQLTPFMQEEMVPCLPLHRVLARHQPENIDVLLIDTEGYDCAILRQFDFARYRPLLIKVEAVHVTESERQAMMALLITQRYIFYPFEQDYLALAHELFFPLLFAGNRAVQAGGDRSWSDILCGA